MLIEHLRERRPDIEDATLTRVLGISDPAESADAEYLDGLRIAVSVALDYGIDALGRASERPGPVPIALLAQARLAARKRVSLDKVLRRYVLGYLVLGDFVVAELEGARISDDVSIKRSLRIEAMVLDHILEAVTEEYRRESDSRTATTEQRRLELVRRLLAGELLDAPDLGYGFHAWHQASIIKAEDAPSIARDLGHQLDRNHLTIRADEMTVWTWFGGTAALQSADLPRAAANERFAHATFIIGEAGHGLAGWRRTFDQAMAAMPIALRLGRPVTCYRDVALLASALQDDLLRRSLRHTYIAPLERERDGGATLRSTLRAYIDTGHNISSAAASLKIGRHTMTKRLRTVEQQIGQALSVCTTELDVALRLEELEQLKRIESDEPDAGRSESAEIR